MKSSAVIILFLMVSVRLFSQSVEYRGTVIDHASGEGIPGATIRIADTRRGTSTNVRGEFRLRLPIGTYRMYVSCLGFRSDSLWIHVAAESEALHWELIPEPIQGDAFDVFANVENPADLVIREAIAKKSAYLALMKNYQFDAYTKSTFRVKIKSKKTARDTIAPAGITETRSEGIWIKPDRYHERIVARRQTKNFLAAQNIFTVGEWLNFNDDVIRLGKHRIVGPTAPDAFDYYRYSLEGTTWLDAKPVYRIHVTPRSRVLPLFEGTVSIMEGTFAVVDVDGRLTEGVDGMLRDYHLRQQFACLYDKYWLPTRLDTRFVMQLESPGFPPILVETVSLLDNYAVNSGLSADSIPQEQLVIAPDADDTSDVYYHRLQAMPLSTDEERVYQRIDSMMQKPVNKMILGTFYAPIRISSWMRKYGLTQVSDFYRYNRVEGHFMGAGWTNERRSPRVLIRAKAGYGLAGQRWIGSLHIEPYVTHRKTLSLVADLYDHTTFMENPDIYSTLYITYTSLIGHNDYRDYYRTRGMRGGMRLSLTAPLSVQLSMTGDVWKKLRMETDYSLFNRKHHFRKNPVLDQGRRRAWMLDIRWDTRRFIDGGWYRILSPSQPAWWIQFNAEKTLSGTGSDFAYEKAHVTVLRHQPTWYSFYSDIHLFGGWVRGRDIPLQQLFVLESAYAGSARLGSLRTLSPNAYAGHRAALIWQEHHFGNVIFKWLGIPYLKKSSADLILFHGLGYTALQKKVPSPFDRDTRKPIQEAGVGLGHMYFRLDMAWRLTAREDRLWALRWSASLL